MAAGFEAHALNLETYIRPEARLVQWDDNFNERVASKYPYYDELMVYSNPDDSLTYVHNVVPCEQAPLIARPINSNSGTPPLGEIVGDFTTLKRLDIPPLLGKALSVMGFSWSTNNIGFVSEIVDLPGTTALSIPSAERYASVLDYLRGRTGFAPQLVGIDQPAFTRKQMEDAAERRQILVSSHIGVCAHDMAIHNTVWPLFTERAFELLADRRGDLYFANNVDAYVGIELAAEIAKFAGSNADEYPPSMQGRLADLLYGDHRVPAEKISEINQIINGMAERLRIIADMPSELTEAA